MTAEASGSRRTATRRQHWKRWGPYLSERAWGTVREDYSADGTAWDYFPHDHARSRAYRWNEDGIAGICDRHQRICFALALWNGRDPILKERLFGLTGNEGNHGEDVKEYYFYLDSHADALLHEVPVQVSAGGVSLRAARRGEPRGADEPSPNSSCSTPASSTSNRYFDVFVEYAKAIADDILIRITATNRGPEPRRLASAADALVPQYVVVGTRRGAPELALRAIADGVTRSSSTSRRTAGAGCTAKARRSCCSPRTKPTPSGCSASPNAPPLRQGRHQRLRRRRRRGGGESRRRRAPRRRRCYAAVVRPAGEIATSGCGSPT